MDWKSRVRVVVLHGIYDAFFTLALLVASPYLLYRIVTSGRFRAGLCQRFGFIPRRRSPDRPCLWIHGVSVGEIQTAEALIEELGRRHPDVEIVLSTTTATGQKVARRRHPDRTIFYYPLDFSLVTHRVIRRIRPDAILLMELEIWPNFLLACALRQLPVAVVNGRISQKSFVGYRRLRRILPEPFGRVSLYCVQTEEYSERLLALAVDREKIFVTGNMKYDNISTESAWTARAALESRFGIAATDRVLIGGSTHSGEEEALVEIYRKLRRRHPGLRLVVAPRHPQRAQEVRQIIERRGLRCLAKTDLDAESISPRGDEVILLDTVGDLPVVYALGTLVFVGGSLIPHGGQNMMEPAAHGKPVLFGLHTFNFREDVAILLEHEAAIQVSDADDLATQIARLLSDEAAARVMGERAQAVIRERKGATKRIADLLEDHLGHRFDTQRRSGGSGDESNASEAPAALPVLE